MLLSNHVNCQSCPILGLIICLIYENDQYRFYHSLFVIISICVKCTNFEILLEGFCSWTISSLDGAIINEKRWSSGGCEMYRATLLFWGYNNKSIVLLAGISHCYNFSLECKIVHLGGKTLEKKSSTKYYWIGPDHLPLSNISNSKMITIHFVNILSKYLDLF